MKSLSVVDWIALILVIIGGLNWGLVGLFQLDLVGYLFGSMYWVATVIYVLVGLSALYMLFTSTKLCKK